VRRLAALILCTFALAAACSRTSSAPAASANGTAISTHDLVDELNAISSNRDYIDSLQSNSPTGGVTVLGSTPGSFDAAFVSQVLLRQLDYSLIHAEVKKRHLTIDDACRNEARNDAQLNLGQSNAAKGEQLFNKFPTRYQDLLVERNADVIVLESALAGQQCGKAVDAEAYYRAHPDDFTKICVSLIALNDATQADGIVTLARGGADFAGLVRQFSVDATSKATDGAIGCRLPSAFNATVASLLSAAKPGDVLEPLPGQSGVSIVKITDRQLAPLDEVRSQAEELATTTSGQAFSTWLRQARADSKVTVDALYGTFDPATFRINPPTLDLTTTTSPPAAASSSSSDTP
jgi:parvulin-like peptidyl-prolyl isomerase